MKAFITLFLMASFLFSRSQSFELQSNTVSMDTINLTDANGKKQGKWVMNCLHKRPCNCGNMYQTLETGMYKDNRKTGEWKQFYCNGNLKNIIHFVNGIPDGPTKIYYESGKLHEEGTWKNNRWTGNYKSYDPEGNVTEIEFDEKGKEISRKSPPLKKPVPSKKK